MGKEDTSCLVYRIKDKIESANVDDEVGTEMFNYQFTRILKNKGEIYNVLRDDDEKKKKISDELLSFLESSCRAKHSEYIIICLYAIERLNFQGKKNTLHLPNLEKCIRLLITSGNFKEDVKKVKKCLSIFFCIYTPYSDLILFTDQSQIENTFWRKYKEKSGADFFKNNLELCKFLYSIRYTVIQENVNKLAYNLFYKAKSGSLRDKYKTVFIDLLRDDVITGLSNRQLVIPSKIYDSKKYRKSLLHFIDNFKNTYNTERDSIESLIKIRRALKDGKSINMLKDIEKIIRDILKNRTLTKDKTKDFLGYKTRDSFVLALFKLVMDEEFYTDYIKILDSIDSNDNNDNNVPFSQTLDTYNSSSYITGGKRKRKSKKKKSKNKKRKTQRKTKRGNRKTKKKSRKRN